MSWASKEREARTAKRRKQEPRGSARDGEPRHDLYYNGHGDLAAEADAGGTRITSSSYDPFGTPLGPPPANKVLNAGPVAGTSNSTP